MKPRPSERHGWDITEWHVGAITAQENKRAPRATKQGVRTLTLKRRPNGEVVITVSGGGNTRLKERVLLPEMIAWLNGQTEPPAPELKVGMKVLRVDDTSIYYNPKEPRLLVYVDDTVSPVRYICRRLDSPTRNPIYPAYTANQIVPHPDEY